MAQEQNSNAKKTIYMLYVPGGAMLGIGPLTTLSMLEELTDLSSLDMFQAFEGVSTGSIVISSILSGYSAKLSTKRYEQDGQRFFKPISRRGLKMAFTNVAHGIITATDPQKDSRWNLDQIHSAVNEYLTDKKEDLNDNQIKALKQIRNISKQDTISAKQINTISQACSELTQDESLNQVDRTLFQQILDEMQFIEPNGFFASAFYKTARAPFNSIIRKCEDHYFPSEVPEETFKGYFGEKRLSQQPKSFFIAAFNEVTKRRRRFSHIKDDLFANDPDAPGTTSRGDVKLREAVMSSIASPVAFKPYPIEDGMYYSDQAPLNNAAVGLSTIWANKPDDVDIKLVYLGCGKEKVPFEYEDHVRSGMSDIKRVISNAASYINDDAQTLLENIIGKDNVVVFEPELVIKPMDSSRHKRKSKFLKKSEIDQLSAAPENVQKIKDATLSYLSHPKIKANLHTLAVELCQNLYNLGQIDEDHLEKVKARCTEARIDAEHKPEYNKAEPQGLWERFKSWRLT